MAIDESIRHKVDEVDSIRSLEIVEAYEFPGIGARRHVENGCEIYQTKGGRSIFLLERGNCLVHFPTTNGVQAYYEIKHVELPKKIKTVLMDLDGTTIQSEHFWINILEMTMRIVLEDREFRFHEEDMPFIAGFSVTDHLQYALTKYSEDYCDEKLSLASSTYFHTFHERMDFVLGGQAKNIGISASPHLKEFLLTLKRNDIKIGVVTSGLYEKALPELLSVFEQEDLGSPLDFYDAVITAGYTVRKGSPGTLGELESKPHPWLYAEAMKAIGTNPNETVVIEDSAAGVLAARSAGIAVIGLRDGNIATSGALPLCSCQCDSLVQVWETIHHRVI